MEQIHKLKFQYLTTQKLTTCHSEENLPIETVCKHTDYITPGYWFLDERGDFSQEGIKVIGKNSPLVKTTNPRKTWAELSSIAFQRKPNFIALVTGTDGKTSTAWITYQIWKSLGIKAGYIGTLGIFNHHTKYESSLTSLDSADLHYHLEKMYDNDVQYVVIEASSIGLDQDRLEFIRPKIAVFTSFASDHMDYHKTPENYLNAKLKILNNLKKHSNLFIHESIRDNKTFRKQFNQTDKFQVYGGNSKYKSYYTREKTWQLEIDENEHMVYNDLIGSFNGDNMLAAFIIARKSKFAERKIIQQLSKLKPVPGRCELVGKHNQGDIFVDFAHTPNALEKTLKCLNEIYKNVYLVFGCGGDRDKTKRSLMGEVAHLNATKTIITNDNPRSEDPMYIAKEIQTKCPEAQIILDRKEAIQEGIKLLEKDSVLLVAGKGEEGLQIFADKIENFHDESVINQILQTLK